MATFIDPNASPWNAFMLIEGSVPANVSTADGLVDEIAGKDAPDGMSKRMPLAVIGSVMLIENIFDCVAWSPNIATVTGPSIELLHMWFGTAEGFPRFVLQFCDVVFQFPDASGSPWGTGVGSSGAQRRNAP